MISDSIELWLVDLDGCAITLDEVERAAPRLSSDDLKRARAVSDSREQRHRLAAYTALRILLERMAGTDLRQAPFVRTVAGKPRLPTGAPEFSLSHIDGLALIGISKERPIGVDLERDRVARMAPQRIAEIIAMGIGLSGAPLTTAGHDLAFIQAWSRLEAFCKMRGRGLSQTLTDVGIRGNSQPRPSPAEIEARARKLASEEDIGVTDLNPLPGIHGAVGLHRGTSLPPLRTLPASRDLIEAIAAGRHGG